MSQEPRPDDLGFELDQARDEIRRLKAERRSTQTYRELFQSTDEAYALVEVLAAPSGDWTDFRFLEVNPAFMKHTTMPYPVGRTATDLLGAPNPRWAQVYGQVVDTGVSVRLEEGELTLGLVFDLNIFRVGPAEARQVAVLFSDITARKKAEEALRLAAGRDAYRVRLTDALRHAADPLEVQDVAMQVLVDHLGASRAMYGEADPGSADGFTSPRAFRRDPETPTSRGAHRWDDLGPHVAEGLRSGRTLVVDDVASHPQHAPTDLAAYDRMGVRSYLAAPLVRDGRIAAYLAVGCAAPRDWTPEEAALVEETADRTWAAVQRARVETELRDSEERLGLAVDVGEFASWDWDLTTNVVSWNQRHFTLQGYVPGEVEPSFEAWLARVHPDDREEATRRIARAQVDGEDYVHEFRGLLPDGSIRWFAARGRFFRSRAGAASRMIGLMEDITGRKASEDALRESEQRFRQFAQASSAALWIRDALTLEMEYVSPSIEALYGVAPEAFEGEARQWAATIVPEDRAEALEPMEAARHGESAVHEFRIQRASDGAFRWIRNTVFPLLNGSGQVQRIGGIAADVTDEKLAVEHQAILLAELQHRVRNIMAMLRSVTARTAASAATVADYQGLMTGRLMALARTQTLLTRTVNAGVEIAVLLHEELSAQAHREGQFVLSGPKVVISPKAAEVLALTVHELTTNALKYGALSTPDGAVAVAWRIIPRQGDLLLRLDWRETRAACADWTAPRRRGFGTELIERRVPYELGGRGQIDITPEGARAMIEFPLKPGSSILETDAPLQSTVPGGSIDMSGEQSLAGHTVLVLEDDYYLAEDAVGALRSAGAEVVGPCPTVRRALAAIRTRPPTAAVLDVNLGFGPSFELAAALTATGTPFLFLTGYDADVVPDAFAHVPRLQKPVELRDIVRAVIALTGAGP